MCSPCAVNYSTEWYISYESKHSDNRITFPICQSSLLTSFIIKDGSGIKMGGLVLIYGFPLFLGPLFLWPQLTKNWISYINGRVEKPLCWYGIGKQEPGLSLDNSVNV